jgi:single-stranded-DNA-specific exonuclease
MRPPRWLGPPPDSPDLAEFARALDAGLPAARVLWNRGYNTQDSARRFLSPALGHLHDPLLMKDMDRAVARLRRAVEEREKILLYGDYDVDGTISIVTLLKALEMAGNRPGFHVPHRLRDGYGMRSDVIDDAADRGVKLIISVDTGIRANDVVAHAQAKGIDVIVTDHHLPETDLPPAYAVLNPNRPDCGYPEKNLCGAGVTFKLVQALLENLGWVPPRVERVLLSFLKLVAMATVADVVPLTGENRVIVKLGLAGLYQVRNAGLRALLEVSGIEAGDCPTATQVAFQLAPRINAAGRMDDAAEVVHMFLSEDGDRAAAIAKKLHELNKERQDTERKMVEEILAECERVPVTDGQAALVFSGRGWHKGVVGIVASRIVDRFYRPVIVLSEDHENGLASGSARSVPGFHLLEALETMGELFDKFGGHRQAAGMTLPLGRVEEFRERLAAHAARLLNPDDFRPTVELDAPLYLPELSERSAEEVLALAPFGFGNPEPLFSVWGVEVAGPTRALGERGYLIPLRQEGRLVTAKTWNFAGRGSEFTPGLVIDAAIAIQNDDYSRKRGYPGWCLTMKDMRAAAVAAGSAAQS